MTSFETKRNETLPEFNFSLIKTLTISSNVIGALHDDNDGGDNDDDAEEEWEEDANTIEWSFFTIYSEQHELSPEQNII